MCNHGFIISRTEPIVLFVCEHGVAKSVVAATLLERLAAAGGRRVRTLARGTNPDPEVPAAVVNGLRDAGIPFEPTPPLRLEPSELAAADHVVSFGPRLDREGVERWDVPAVADGYAAAHAAIAAHVAELLLRLAELSAPQR